MVTVAMFTYYMLNVLLLCCPCLFTSTTVWLSKCMSNTLPQKDIRMKCLHGVSQVAGPRSQFLYSSLTGNGTTATRMGQWLALISTLQLEPTKAPLTGLAYSLLSKLLLILVAVHV